MQYDGEKTAKFINSIYDNPSKWWFEKKTQKIRENFCSKFAVNKKNPYKEMISTLNNILIDSSTTWAHVKICVLLIKNPVPDPSSVSNVLKEID